MAPNLRPWRLLALMTAVSAQGAAPSPNSLLNDLRTMQFPSAPMGGMGGMGSMGGMQGQGAGGFGLGQMGMGGQQMGQGSQMGFGGSMGMAAQGVGAQGMGAAQPPGHMGFGAQMPGQTGFGAQAQVPGQMGGGAQIPGQMGFGAQAPSQMGFGGQLPSQMGGQMPGQMGQPAMGGMAQQQAEMAGERTLDDLDCSRGPHGGGWSTAKQTFRSVFHSSLPWQPVARETLSATMEAGVVALRSAAALAPEAADECGLGKLTIQLFSFAAIDDPQVLPQLFAGFEPLASPVLTTLLDLPWAALAQAGWPIFGVLAQINLRKAQIGALNDDAVDGLDDAAARQFQAELSAALAGKDGLAAQKAAGVYMATGPQGQSALGPLTAMAAQAMAAPDPQERLQLLEVLQQAFKQVIGSGAELDLALSTKWPLWGLLHVAVDAFSG